MTGQAMAATAIRPLPDFRVVDSHPRFWGLFADGRWEPGTLAALGRHLGPGRRFVDVGAWIGPTSLEAARLGADVVAFEPDPAAFDLLRRNLDLNPELAERIEAVPLALAPESGPMQLHSREAGNSETSVFDLHLRNGEAKPARLAFDVEGIGVAEACERYGFPDADLVKLDLEGAEYLLLPSLIEALGPANPPLLLSFHPMNLVALPTEEQRRLGESCLCALTDYSAEAWSGDEWRAADPDCVAAAAHQPDAGDHTFLLQTDPGEAK